MHYYETITKSRWLSSTIKTVLLILKKKKMKFNAKNMVCACYTVIDEIKIIKKNATFSKTLDWIYN